MGNSADRLPAPRGRRFTPASLALALSLLGAPLLALAAPASATPAREPFKGASFAALRTYVTAHHIETLADLLPSLPEDLRASFVLVRQTQSLQAPTTPLEPRAILFGAEARFIVTFNATGQSLEVIEEPQGADHFLFARVQFAEHGPTAFYAGEEAESRFECASCHAGRPLWGQYREWAGVYGGDQEDILVGSPEDQDYRALLEKAKTHPLYRNLVFKCGSADGVHGKATIPGHIRIEDKADPSFPTCVDETVLVAGAKDPGRFRRRLYQPSEALGEAFSRLNASRLATAMKARPAYPAYEYALLAVELGCAGDKLYIPSHRAEVADRAALLDAGIRERGARAGLPGRSIEHAVLNLLGVDIDRDIRLDVLQPHTPSASILGLDFPLRGGYSVNPDGRTYPSSYADYNDATDFTPDLLAFLVLRNVLRADGELRAVFAAAVAQVPRGTTPGYGDSSFASTLESFEESDLDASLLPKYVDKGFFQPILATSARPICDLITRRALERLPALPPHAAGKEKDRRGGGR
jgi:hypothetical protein